MKILWKDVKGYEGKYQVGSNGKVKSLKRFTGVLTVRERILKEDKGKVNHRRVTLSKDGKTERFFVHRLVYETFVSEIEEGLVINHIDGNPSNNCIENLEMITKFQNAYHAKGRNAFKLCPEDVIFIKKSKLKTRVLSEMFGVRPRQISRIKKGDRWKCVDEAIEYDKSHK